MHISNTRGQLAERIRTLEVRVVGTVTVISVHARVELVGRSLLCLLSRLSLDARSLSCSRLGSGLFGGFLSALSTVAAGVRVVERLKETKVHVSTQLHG